jgi:uncharacterized caspase-like protein
VRSTRRILTVWALWLLASCASASDRVALVIGNGSYQHATHLANPGNDARLLGETLRGLGFDVTEQVDLGRNAMERTVLDFSRRASGAEVALIFFAGHGIQMAGHNYLLPVDARLEDDLSLRVEAVNLDLLLESVAGAGTRLVVLDACRNNPFASRMRMSNPNRSVTRGLGKVEVAEGGTLIAFSTSPDDVATDGDGRNSPFSTALARHLRQPGLEIRQVFTRVRAEVRGQTKMRQTPWENSSLLTDVFLAGTTPVPPDPRPVIPAPAFDPRQAELAFWQGTQQADTLAAYRAYKQRYPSGDYAALADIQIEKLSIRSTPSATAQFVAQAEVDSNGFIDQGNGVLFDTQTGLEWTQHDNGSPTNWSDAERYCANLSTAGSGWRLPLIDEFAAIYNRPGGGTAVCGSHTCKISPAFRLSTAHFWSGTQPRSSEAWYIWLFNATRTSDFVSHVSRDLRALCVRRRS